MSHPVAIIIVPTLKLISLGTCEKSIAFNSHASTQEKHSTQIFRSISYKKGTACPNAISIAFRAPRYSSK
ncbi:MAG: hypothetical protein ACFFAN_20890 [Promethearchaeota archaeon]